MDYLDILCGPCSRNPRKFITYAWFVSVLLVGVIFVVACIAASRVTGYNKAVGFCVVWTAILCLFLVVGGTAVMKRYHTPTSMGFLLGVVVVMSQQCLILSVIFGGISDQGNDTADALKADRAAAVFLFFLFVVYGFFAGLLTMFRNKLLEEEQASQTQEAASSNV